MKHDKYKTQLAEMRDLSGGTETPSDGKLDKRELSKHFAASAKSIINQEGRLSLLEQRKNSEPDKPELIIECLSEEKKIIDALSLDLRLAVGGRSMSIAKEIKAKLIRHLKRYNALVAEYREKTGTSLTEAPYSIADDIIAGRDYAVLPVLTYSKESVSVSDERAEGDKVELVSTRQFLKYAQKSDKSIAPLLEKYEILKAKKDKAIGQERVILILDSLSVKKSLIESECKVVSLAARSSSSRNLREARKILISEIDDYNSLVGEYESLTGKSLTYASHEMADVAAAGGECQSLPSISYTVNDPTKGGREDKNYQNANKNVQNAAYNKNKVVLGALEKKISEQSNKDLSVLTKRADFEVSLLESERDITRYRFGKPPRATRRRKKEIAAEIAHIKLAHKEALRYEEADNKRYYEAVRINPETERFEKNGVDIVRLSSIRSRIIMLLNTRDEINSQLIAIYTGNEVDHTGVSVNQEWRRVKAEAADRVIAKDRKIARKVNRLPATPQEKRRIYAAMNKKLDAESTIALSLYRLKTEKLQKQEIKDLRADISKQRAISYRCAEDVNWMCEQIMRKYGQRGSAAGWILGFLIILLTVVGAAAAFLWFFGQDILRMLGLL